MKRGSLMYKQIPFDVELIIHRYIHRYNIRLVNQEYDKLFKSHFNEIFQCFCGCDDLCCNCRIANYRYLYDNVICVDRIYKIYDMDGTKNDIGYLPNNY